MAGLSCSKLQILWMEPFIHAETMQECMTYIWMYLETERRMDMDNQQLPIGFGLSLAMNQKAMNRFANMTEAGKEKAIAKSRDAKSKREMDRIVDSLAGDYGIVSSLYGTDSDIG